MNLTEEESFDKGSRSVRVANDTTEETVLLSPLHGDGCHKSNNQRSGEYYNRRSYVELSR